MKHLSRTFLFCLLLAPAVVSAQSSFTRGVFLSNRDSVNLIQMHDTLGLNTAQRQSGRAWDNMIMDNTNGIKIYNQRPYLADRSMAQQMVFEAERTTSDSGLFNWFSEHPTGGPSCTRRSLSRQIRLAISGSVCLRARPSFHPRFS
jgi:hypothetical protein